MREREAVHSPSLASADSLLKMPPPAGRNSIQVSHSGDSSPITWAITVFPPRGSELTRAGARRLSWKLSPDALLWVSSTLGSAFTPALGLWDSDTPVPGLLHSWPRWPFLSPGAHKCLGGRSEVPLLAGHSNGNLLDNKKWFIPEQCTHSLFWQTYFWKTKSLISTKRTDLSRFWMCSLKVLAWGSKKSQVNYPQTIQNC